MEISLSYFVRNRLVFTIAMISAFVQLSLQKLAFYVRFDFNFILLLLVLPFVIKKQSNSKSIRYGVAAIILLILYPVLRISSVYFFALVCTILFIYEYQYGQLSSIPLFLVIIVSPVVIFFTEILGFETRLWLTKIAAGILKFIDSEYDYSGNIILIGKNEFHVDSECMGLKMVLLSMFVDLIFITYHQQKKKGQIYILYVFLSLVISYILVAFSNLCRIVLITLFRSSPETFSHEMTGIICFAFYVALPLWYITKALPVITKECEPRYDSKPNRIVFLSFIVALLGFFFIYRFTDLGSKESTNHSIVSPEYFHGNYTCSVEEHNVLKLTNDDFLIYIKPAASFYSADHSPIICWKGSGYKVIKEQIISIKSKKVYFSELKKDQDILFSTWWYDSGNDKTISQYRWRFKNMIDGYDYQLINIVSGNRDDLLFETGKLLSENILK